MSVHRYPFVEGTAKSPRFGWIDEAGRCVVEPKYYYLGNCRNGIGYYQTGAWKYGLIDASGRELTKPEFASIHLLTSDCARASVKKRSGFLPGLLFVSGGWLPLPEIEDIGGLSECGLLNARKKGGRCGFIDLTGRFVTNPDFDELYALSEGLAAARVGQKWGYVNRSGEFVIPPVFQEARRFSEGLASVVFEGSRRVINQSNETVFETPFPLVTEFINGLALCSTTTSSPGKYGFVTSAGEVRIPSVFDSVDLNPFAEEFAAVRTGVESYYIDTRGEAVFGRTFLRCRSFRDGMGRVSFRFSSSSRSGYLNRSGELVWEGKDF